MSDLGYMVFSDFRYQALTRVLVDGLLACSKHRIVVDTFDWVLSNPDSRVIARNHSGHFGYAGGVSQMEYSIAQLLESPFRVTCQLDVDTVVTPRIDDIFEYADHRFPMQMVHPHNPHVLDSCRCLMDRMGVKRALSPYVHHSPFVFTRSNLRYIRGAYDCWQKFKETPVSSQFHDERLLAVYRWSQGVVPCIPYLILDHTMFESVTEYTLGLHGRKDPESARALQQSLLA